MSQKHTADIIILGTGPAGYTAALYASRAELKPLLISGMQPGGQLTLTDEVENYPGFAKPIQGPWLMSQMEQQALSFGTKMQYDTIISAQLDKTDHFILEGDSGDTYEANALIIATGARARWLGLPREEELRGKGVSACATCDGPFFRKKRVAVVGGGNTAVSDALYLSRFVSHVTLIHRRDSFRCEEILKKRIDDTPNISIIWDHQIKELHSGGQPEKLTSITIENVKTNAQRSIDIDGLFVAIGHIPQTDLFKGQLSLDEKGYILTDPKSTQTSHQGVFAAGDVQDNIYQQAVTAAATGCMAAMEAQTYLASIADRNNK